jgi:hypothetical protein
MRDLEGVAIHRSRFRHSVAKKPVTPVVLYCDQRSDRFDNKARAGHFSSPRVAFEEGAVDTTKPDVITEEKGTVLILRQNLGWRAPDVPPTARHCQSCHETLRTRNQHASRGNVAHRGRLSRELNLARHASEIGISRRESIHVNAIVAAQMRGDQLLGAETRLSGDDLQSWRKLLIIANEYLPSRALVPR